MLLLKLLRNWLFVQTAAVNPDAKKSQFKNMVMGEVDTIVSSHEVGHSWFATCLWW